MMSARDEGWVLYRSRKSGFIGWLKKVTKGVRRPLEPGEVTAIRRKRPSDPTEQLVHILIPLSDGHVGRTPEREAITRFEDQIDHILMLGVAGLYDGHELGNGVYNVIFRCGDPVRLAEEIRPFLDLAWVRGEIMVQIQTSDRSDRIASPELRKLLLEPK